MNSKLKLSLVSLILLPLTIPFIVHAALFSDFRGLVNFLISLFNQAIALLIGLGVVYLLYSIVKTIMHADNEQIRSDGRHVMLYGVIAIFVIVSMWGFVNVLVNTFFAGGVPGLP